MRLARALTFAVLSLSATAVVVACATADESDPAPDAAPLDGGSLVVDDAGPDVLDAAFDASPPTCSDAGWCRTVLPDPNLTLSDLWPLASGEAFALVAEAPRFVGDVSNAQVMEWNGTSWSILADNGAQHAFPTQPGNLWAPGTDEIWFSLVATDGFTPGIGGSYVLHGVRPIAPATTWSWTATHFTCSAADPHPYVWGTSADDVYALSCGRLYHRSPSADAGSADSGAPGWDLLYKDRLADSDHAAQLEVLAGTSSTDLWIAGSRAGVCGLLLHKTTAGVTTVVDGVVGDFGECDALAPYALAAGTFTSLAAPSVGIALLAQAGADGTNRVVQARQSGTATSLSGASIALDPQISGVWGASADDVWATVSTTDAEYVVHGLMPFVDGGAFDVSTIAINGSRNDHALSFVRGTTSSNIWVGGSGVALHKSTP